MYFPIWEIRLCTVRVNYRFASEVDRLSPVTARVPANVYQTLSQLCRSLSSLRTSLSVSEQCKHLGELCHLWDIDVDNNVSCIIRLISSRLTEIYAYEHRTIKPLVAAIALFPLYTSLSYRLGNICYDKFNYNSKLNDVGSHWISTFDVKSTPDMAASGWALCYANALGTTADCIVTRTLTCAECHS